MAEHKELMRTKAMIFWLVNRESMNKNSMRRLSIILANQEYTLIIELSKSGNQKPWA